jgi:hypothetical protein
MSLMETGGEVRSWTDGELDGDRRGGAGPVSSMEMGTREELDQGELDGDGDEGGAGLGQARWRRGRGRS